MTEYREEACLQGLVVYMNMAKTASLRGLVICRLNMEKTGMEVTMSQRQGDL